MNRGKRTTAARRRFRLGMTPGGDVWNIPRATILKLHAAPERDMQDITFAALRFFVSGKPGDVWPTLENERNNAMLQELISGKPQGETGVGYGL